MLYIPRVCKHCRTCLELKPFSDFTLDRTMGDNLRASCRDCRRIEARLWKRNNPDKVKATKQRYYAGKGGNKARAYSRTYNAEHPEERRAYMKVWRTQNYEDVLEYNRLYNARHSQQMNEYRRNLYRENPQPFNALRQRRRARQKAAPGHHTSADLERQHEQQQGRCYWCSKSFNNDATIDHITPLTRGGSNDPSNLVIACRSCNSRKRTRLPYTEWIPPNPLKD